MAMGQVIYFLIALVLIMDEIVLTNKDFSTVPGFVVPIVVLILVVSSKLLYNYLINSKIQQDSEAEKLDTYRKGNIIKFALFEGANLLSITFYLLSADFLYAGMSVVVMGIFLINYPGKETFMQEFGLSSYRTNLNK